MKLLIGLFCSGIVSASLLASLPNLYWLIFLFLSLLTTQFFLKSLRFYLWAILSFLLGFTYGVYSGYQALDNRLSIQWQEQEFIVQGLVMGLPAQDDRHQQFQFTVNKAAKANDFENVGFNQTIKFPKEISVALYDEKSSIREKIEPGDFRQFRIKVKRPRTLVNPHGYDSEIAQIRRGIGATAYVKPGKDSINFTPPDFRRLFTTHPLIAIDNVRLELRVWLLNHKMLKQPALLVALLIGDTSSIEKQEWLRFNQTGTLHLIAISGLHLGFFALIGYYIGRTFGKFIGLFWFRCNAYFGAHFFALIFVVAYSFLAGMNIPTLRTLIMLLVLQMGWLLKRQPPGFHVWCFALAVVLVIDPFSVYDKGFWLSFAAVGLLIFYFSGRSSIVENNHWGLRTKRITMEFLKSQWLMLIGLLIPLSLLNSQVSLCAPFANLVAIPLVTFFVVPCLIAATFFHFVSSSTSEFFLGLADWGANLFQVWLEKVLHYSEFSVMSEFFSIAWKFSPQAIPLAIVSILFILLPKGLRSTRLGCVALAFSLCIPLPNPKPLEILTFDVGQGTAILVKTSKHQLLYDTGPKYSEKFDAGDSIIQPYLKAEAVQVLDALVVSHNDRDHSGGLQSVLDVFAVRELYLGQLDLQEKLSLRSNLLSEKNIETCHQKKSWNWDQIFFQFVDYPVMSNKSNNQSCVLLIQYGNQKILLTGDIEKPVERVLLGFPELKSLTVLFAAHHGSHTSSSKEFIELTQPKYVVYSAGYHNQHGHPHLDVQQLFADQGAIPFNTAYAGALMFSWPNPQGMEINAYRNRQRHFWYWDDVGDRPKTANEQFDLATDAL